MKLESLNQEGRHALANALGDSPWTVTPVHLLRRGMCTAFAAGDPSLGTAAVIQWNIRPHEPAVFGADAEAIWRLLQCIDGWQTINAGASTAYALGALVERASGRGVRYAQNMHYVLTKPPMDYSHPLVRRLTEADVRLIEDAPPFLRQGRAFGGPAGLLREGCIVGAVHSGRLVATAHTSVTSDGYADIGVATLEPYRRQGIASAAASLVCHEVRATGRTPVWNCDEDNVPSRDLAEKIGFTVIEPRIDLVPVAE